jgi:hypothetical protein
LRTLPVRLNLNSSQQFFSLLRPQAKMTPKAFIHKIHEICCADLQHVVLPEVRPRCTALYCTFHS